MVPRSGKVRVGPGSSVVSGDENFTGKINSREKGLVRPAVNGAYLFNECESFGIGFRRKPSGPPGEASSLLDKYAPKGGAG